MGDAVLEDFRGKDCAFLAPQTSAEPSGKKPRPTTEHLQIWEVHTGLKKFRARLSSRKDQKGLMKGEDLSTGVNYSVNSHA